MTPNSYIRLAVGLLLFALAGVANGQWFLPSWLYAIGGGLQVTVIADVDGDDRNDVIVGRSCLACGFLVFIQDDEGNLTDPVVYPESEVHSVAAGDLNDDGLTDIALATHPGLAVYYQAGGLLDGPHDHGLPGTTSRVGVADFTQDGRDDAVVLGSNDRVHLFVQGEDGDLERIDFGLVHSGRDLDVADLNGDGLADLTTVGGFLIAVLYQSPDPDEIFGNAFYYDPALGQTLLAVAVADLDGDTDPDIALAHSASSPASVVVLHQGPPGFFSEVTHLPLITAAKALEAADFDGSGSMDLAAQARTLSFAYGATVWFQDCAGGLSGSEEHETAPASYGDSQLMAAGDVDSDGHTDLVLAADNAGLVVLYRDRAVFFLDRFETPELCWSAIVAD